ncbi:MAG: tetratricopeptide repeat protein, partial [Myxococcota bacterium]
MHLKTLRSTHTSLLYAALLWLTLVVAPACHNYYDAGLEALRSGNAAQAEQQARKGLAEEPDDPWLNLLMAEALIAQERWAEARPYAGRAVQKRPKRPEPRVALGEALIRLNNISAGLVQWVAALEMDQGKMQPYIAEMRELLPKGIGSALETDQPWAAVRMIGALRQLDPQHPDASDLKLREAREAYAQKLVRVVRYQQAADLYGELADRWPDRPEYRLEQGALQLALEQREAAIQTLEAWVAAATTDADRAKHLSAAGERAFDRNVLDLAEQYWTRALETDPKLRSAHVNLARVHLQQRQAEQGYEHLRAYIDAAPTDPRGFEDAAQVALDYNNGAIALEVLEEASLKATPDFTVTTLLADLYQRRQRRADMEEALQRFIDRADNDREATLEVTEWLEKKREVELAAYHLEKAIAAGGKEDPQLWYRLARLHAAADKPEEMEQALREYVERSDQQLDATMAAARLLMQKR